MATQPTTHPQPPKLSSFLAAANEWFGEEYALEVVRGVLNSRDQFPSDIRRALNSAIRGSGVRVPGAQFQLKEVQDAATHHLQSPVLRKMQSSDELTEAVLRAWVSIQNELYESVVQHLQWNDEPTYGPDRREMSFRGHWDARDWQTNYNQFLADRTGFDQRDVGLMLWYVSGKLPPAYAEVEDPYQKVDFDRWRELLLALRADASQWEDALAFADSIRDLVEEKEKQRAREAVTRLRTKTEDIWMEYSEELIYLECDVERWHSARHIQPEEALKTLAQVTNLESLLSQYRPIRDQAQSRSVEFSRAGRRAELEAEIISTVAGLSGVFGTGEEAAEGSLANSASEEYADPETPDDLTELAPGLEELTEVAEMPLSTLPLAEPTQQSIDGQPSLELLPPAEPSPSSLEVEPVSDDVNGSILAGLQTLQNDLELLKARLASANGSAPMAKAPPQNGAIPTPEPEPATSTHGLAAVVADAKKLHARRLVFRLSSDSIVSENPYEDTESVSDALEWLASTYPAARQGDLDAVNLNKSLYRSCRWKYSSNHQDQDFFQKEGRYRILVNGKAYYLNESIGKGMGRDPVNTIRIAFFWDAQSEKVVIGYIGPHLPDDKR